MNYISLEQILFIIRSKRQAGLLNMCKLKSRFIKGMYTRTTVEIDLVMKFIKTNIDQLLYEEFPHRGFLRTL
jgi:hypothetical protein